MSTLLLCWNIIRTLLQFTFTGPILNILVIFDLIRRYPISVILVVVIIAIVYKFFIFLGFNQKRSIKLSSPYLDGKYYLHQLAQGIPDPHTLYHLEPGILSRPMYCFVCEGNVNGWNNEGLCCDICGYTVHQRCVSKQPLGDCKNISTFPSLTDALHYCQHGLKDHLSSHTTFPTHSYHLKRDDSTPVKPSFSKPLSITAASPMPSTTRSRQKQRIVDIDNNNKKNDNNLNNSVPTRSIFRRRTRSTTRNTTLEDEDFDQHLHPTSIPQSGRRGSHTRKTIISHPDDTNNNNNGNADYQEPILEHSLSHRAPIKTHPISTTTRNSDLQQQLLSQISLGSLPLEYFPSTSPSDFPLTHHWVFGNHSSISDICFLCGDPVGSVFYRLGMHCLWCGIHVHEECLSQYIPPLHQQNEDSCFFYSSSSSPLQNSSSKLSLQQQFDHNKQQRIDPYVCNLGALAKAIIPPHCIYPGEGFTVATARFDIATKYTHEAIAQERLANGEVVLNPSSFNTSPKLNFPPLFKFTLPSWCYPLLVIINRKSGGNGGVEKMHDFVECLNPLQVWDITKHPPELPLTLFKQSGYPFRVLVCGGDGTFSSVLQSIDHVFGIGAAAQSQTTAVGTLFTLPNNNTTPPPPVATLPLGTGNDLAQVLGWGGKINAAAHPRRLLYDVMNGRLAVLDRWDVKVFDNDSKDEVQLGPPPDPPFQWVVANYFCNLIQPIADWLQPIVPIFMPSPNVVVGDHDGIMNNYIGFGLDAVIAHQFASLRATYPHFFTSQTGNKAIYARVGVGQWLYPYIRNGLNEAPFTSKFYVDGVELTNIGHLQGVCCLGIKSFGGGICFWGDRFGDEDTIQTDPTSGGQFQPPALDDGMFELIGFESSAHMLMIQTGQALPHRLAQGKKLEVEILGKLPVQIDGEQWGVRKNCRIVVQLRTQSLMIVPLHSGPTQLQGDNLGHSPITQEINVTNMLHDVMQTGVQSGVISSIQSSQLMINFTKKFTKVNPSSHFYRPSHSID